MTDWQRGYGDAYVNPKFRKYPALPDNEDYMDGYMFGQKEWNDAHSEETEDGYPDPPHTYS